MRMVEEMTSRNNLFVPDKMAYAKGRRPAVECILCEVAAGRDTVQRLEVYRESGFIVSLNLYPYNPGHLLIFPERHVEHPSALSDAEVLAMHRLEMLGMRVLDELYSPDGYNIGMNVGEASGASIRHLHVHVVPRFRRELGFVDIIGGAKIIVEHPCRTKDRVEQAFAEAVGRGECKGRCGDAR